jgi:hypothetical protein
MREGGKKKKAGRKRPKSSGRRRPKESKNRQVGTRLAGTQGEFAGREADALMAVARGAPVRCM